MDEGHRRSNRLAKPRKDPVFLYDEDIIDLIEESGSRDENRQHRLSTTRQSISKGNRSTLSNVSPPLVTIALVKMWLMTH